MSTRRCTQVFSCTSEKQKQSNCPWIGNGKINWRFLHGKEPYIAVKTDKQCLEAVTGMGLPKKCFLQKEDMMIRIIITAIIYEALIQALF